MQKEELLKKLRLWATIITSAFAVLIVSLIFQFAIISNNNKLAAEIQAANAAMRQDKEGCDKDKDYAGNGYGDSYLNNEYGLQQKK